MDAETKALALGYAALSRDEKLRVLASAGKNLANSAKGVSFDYREILQMANEKLLVISDLQGRLAGMMLQLVEDDRAREADTAFVAALIKTAAEAGIDDEMMWALSHAMEEMQVLH
jgi:4-aminobutyrate aminotransferase-like enzyme